MSNSHQFMALLLIDISIHNAKIMHASVNILFKES